MPEIANEDLKIAFTLTPGPPDAVYSGDQGIDAVKIVPTKATKAKVNSKFICTTMISLTFSAANPCPFASATYTFVSGKGTLMAGATKVKADGNFVLLKDDTGTCMGSWTLNVPPFTPIVCSCSLKISDAGQTKVKGV